MSNILSIVSIDIISKVIINKIIISIVVVSHKGIFVLVIQIRLETVKLFPKQLFYNLKYNIILYNLYK